MNRSPAISSLRAFVAVLLAALQLLGALHFSLVQHSFSAALGGVVHVHASAVRADTKPASKARGPQAPSASSDTPSCGAELCSAANAPHSVAPQFESLDAGPVAFGAARLLSERAACSAPPSRVLLGAPKTSPPV